MDLSYFIPFITVKRHDRCRRITLDTALFILQLCARFAYNIDTFEKTKITL